MSGITFGSGTFLRVLDDGTTHKLGDGIPDNMDEGSYTDEAAVKATLALRNLATAAKEVSFTINATFGRRRSLWWLIYGRPQRWPVSNNWLKMHGYPMRRRGHR